MRASAPVNVWPFSLPGVLNKSMNYNESGPFLCAACLSPLFSSGIICLTSVQEGFLNKKWIFVFNVKQGAIKSSDCDIYAKVWLGSPLFVFFSTLFSLLLFIFFCL